MKRPAVAFCCGVVGTTALWLPCYERWMPAARSTRLLYLLTVCAVVVAVCGFVSLATSCKAQANSDPFDSRGAVDAGLLLLCSREGLALAFRMDGQTSAALGTVEQAEVIDYGSRYQIRLQKAEGLPDGLRCLLYSLRNRRQSRGIPFPFRHSGGWKKVTACAAMGFFSADGRSPACSGSKKEDRRYNSSCAAPPKRSTARRCWDWWRAFCLRDAASGAALLPHDAGRGIGPYPAVSGLHIGMAAAFCRKGLEKIGICRRTVELISLLPVWGYIALTGFSLRRCGQASWQPPCRLGMGAGQRAGRAEFTGGGSLLDAAGFSPICCTACPSCSPFGLPSDCCCALRA